MQRSFRLLIALAIVSLNGLMRPSAADELDDLIERRLKQHGVPGLSLAVIEDGRIVRARGYGVMEAGSSTPVSPQTLFQAGSISKPVAGLGALRLVDQERLTLDEDVNLRLTTWKVPENEFTREKKVTLRGLLTHSGGLTVHGFPGYELGTPTPTLAQILNGEKPANTAPVRVDLVPGSRWRYSGGGYTVMQLLMEDVMGQRLPVYMRQAVLEPLGMGDSTFEQPLPEGWRSRAAGGHFPNGRKVAGRWHVYPEMAAAGLWTIPSDLARFAIGVQQAYAGKEGAILSPRLSRDMLTLQVERWGLGPELIGTGRGLRFSHSGRDAGFDAQLTAYAETGRGAVVMINANENRGLVTRVVEAIAKQYRWPEYPVRPDYLPIADDDPKVAALVKQLHLEMQQEKLDRSLFTPELGDRIAASLKERAVFYRDLGALRSVTLVERKDADTSRLHRYRVAFAKWNMLVAVRINRAGKIIALAADYE